MNDIIIRNKKLIINDILIQSSVWYPYELACDWDIFLCMLQGPLHITCSSLVQNHWITSAKTRKLQKTAQGLPKTEKLWIMGGGGRHIYIYIHTCIYIYICIFIIMYHFALPPPPSTTFAK